MLPGQEDFLPIERSSIAERVAKKLLELIRTRDLKPGAMLPTERELAAMMQVSRPSVREAVRGLQILGVLKVRQGHGIFVSPLDAADLLGPLQFLLMLNAGNIEALYEMRILLDTGAARMAAERIEAADLQRLGDLVAAQHDLLGDPLAFRVSDMKFHTIIMEATGNSFVVRTASALYLLGFEYRSVASETPQVLAGSLADHVAILAALQARDANATASAVERHLRNVYRSTVGPTEKQQ